MEWGERAQRGFLASGIDPADRKGHKNYYIDLLQKMALDKVLELKGDEIVLDFGCGSGRISYWIAPRVKRVFGLEVTPEMIDLAEKHRTAPNVEFLLYDGAHFPNLFSPMDIVLSVGVLQTMKEEGLKETIFQLVRYLRSGGRLVLIEQVSDNAKVGRPSPRDYLHAFQEAKLECLSHYSIRKGRWWMLYLIRYGLIPEKWFPRIANYELTKKREKGGNLSYYKDYLFLLKKP